MTGLTGWGTYIPRRRLDRSAIAQANLWFDASLRSLAKGTRSMCNWDEDAVTMAVEAGRQAAPIDQRARIESIYLASTTLPFLDRHNAGLVAEALNANRFVRSMDIAGTQRAATSALIAALQSSGEQQTMVLGSEHRRCRVGSAMEMLSGDGAAAMLIGNEDVVADYLGSVSLASDFLDHYRTAESEFDYGWEERWIRDEGYLKLVPEAVTGLLERVGLSAKDLSRVILPTPQTRVPGSVARALGVDASVMADNLIDRCGETGAAHPLLLLARELESASAGDVLLLLGFGQGVDALCFRVTDKITNKQKNKGVDHQLQTGIDENNYAKFQTFNGVVDREFGKRAESDMPVRPSAHNRNRHTVNAFVGGRCTSCGTEQFPKANYCVNPDCAKKDTQEHWPLSDTAGRVVTYTADRLTFSMDPPSYFGLVEFDGGARANLDFTEVDAERFDVDTRIQMRFRIKQFDRLRGFRSYFWKAAPTSE